MPSGSSSSSSTTATRGERRATALIDSLAQALSPSPTAEPSSTATLKEQLQQLQRHATSYGFTSKQCGQLVHLALYGRKPTAPNARPPRPSTAAAILRCVVPAPKAKVSSDVVYRVLACLGPSPGTKTEAEAGIAKGSVEEDPDASSATHLGPDRVKVDVRVQAAAIRLLSVLLDSPPVPLNLAATLEPVEQGADPRPPSDLDGSLPSSYVTVAARIALQRCYGVLFHFLDYQGLRPHLCYLLCKLTKRKHVKHYRITKLMSLRANSAPEPGLSALLSTYANFYPDLLFPELLGGSGSTSSIGSNGVPGLKFPDNEWLSRALQCHAKVARRSNGETIESDEEAGTETADANRAPPSKRARVSLGGASKSTDLDGARLPLAALPNLVTIQPQTSLNKTLGSSPSLITELSSLRHLAHSLDRLTLPSQVASMLAPTFGARLMRAAVLSGATISNDVSLSQDPAAAAAAAVAAAKTTEADYCWVRLSDWLESVVRDEVGLGYASGGGGGDADQTFDAANEIPSRFEGTICQVLDGLADVASIGHQWSGEWEGLLAEVVAFVPLMKPMAWKDFERSVVVPLERLCAAPSVSETATAMAIEALSEMLRRWARKDWNQISSRLDRGSKVRWGISTLTKRVDYFETVSNTASTLNRMALDALLHHPRSVVVEHAALTGYEVLVGPLSGLHAVYMPPSLAFYALSVSASSVMPISRLAGLTQRIRSSFELDNTANRPANAKAGALERALRRHRLEHFATEHMVPLNKAVLVLVNFVWRGKAFASAFDEDAPALGFDQQVSTELKARFDERGGNFAHLGTVTHGKVFSNLSERFLNEYCQQQQRQRRGQGKDEGEVGGGGRTWIQGPVTVRVLKEARRLGVPEEWTTTKFREHLLEWLKVEGMVGLDALLKNTLSGYLNRGGMAEGEAVNVGGEDGGAAATTTTTTTTTEGGAAEGDGSISMDG